MKKIIVNSALALCTIGLVAACIWSVVSDINFEEEKSEREQKVIAALMQIRDAEEMYKMTYRDYCGDIDSLIDFVKNGKTVGKILKEGDITDEMVEQGITEDDAVRQGLIKRDTTWITVGDTLHIADPDRMKYVPVGKEGAIIQLRKNSLYNAKSQEYDMLIEARACMDDYLEGMSEKKIKTIKADLKKQHKNRADLFDDETDDDEGEWYGLRIGDLLDASNKMAGNWE